MTRAPVARAICTARRPTAGGGVHEHGLALGQAEAAEQLVGGEAGEGQAGGLVPVEGQGLRATARTGTVT